MEKLQPEGLFVGRKYELRRLEEEVGKPRASLIVLYGRRRIGILKETKKTIERVLITTEGITKDLREANYFSKVILIEDLFQ